jgi:hypothetical protein
MTDEDKERFIRAIVAVENLTERLDQVDGRLVSLERMYWRVLGGCGVLISLGGIVLKFL